jgi:hypothetical protein
LTVCRLFCNAFFVWSVNLSVKGLLARLVHHQAIKVSG